MAARPAPGRPRSVGGSRDPSAPLSLLETVCREVGGAASAEGLGWALVGGFAVSVRTEPRFTRDVDLAISVASDDQAEAVVRALRERGHGAEAVVEQEDVGGMAQVRFVLTGGEVVDLLFSSSGVEPEIVDGAEPTEVLPGLVVRVASVGHLIVMKALARDDVRRPQDAADLVALAAAASVDDRRIARTAAELVVQRGYARGRDLVGAVDAVFAVP